MHRRPPPVHTCHRPPSDHPGPGQAAPQHPCTHAHLPNASFPSSRATRTCAPVPLPASRHGRLPGQGDASISSTRSVRTHSSRCQCAACLWLARVVAPVRAPRMRPDRWLRLLAWILDGKMSSPPAHGDRRQRARAALPSSGCRAPPRATPNQPPSPVPRSTVKIRSAHTPSPF